ncbi:MAG: S41 family peptidase [Synergistaceae bacterium]|jgi:carboxyl-terminal processing protease|nr:S41 family peptidase [Synergistaceae bacterium]
MWKRARDLIAGILIGTLLTGVWVTARAESGTDLSSVIPFSAQALWLMKQTRSLLETYHVDGDKPVEEKKLLYGAVRGILQAWGDPYTRFLDPAQLKEEEIEVQGEYGGLGIYIAQKDGRTLVVSPIEGTPAERAGIKPNDEIVKIGEEVILGWDQDRVVKALRGPAGTSVTIWIRREKVERLLKFDLKRENIALKTVKLEKLEDGLVYIRLSFFNEKTAEEMRKALAQANGMKAKGIILDLRNNPGGLLNAATDVVDMFVDEGVIVGMKGRFERANEVIYATRGTQTRLPVVVLVNEGSASASEIVSGALKDLKRAKIVGKKTFGKGSVQTLFHLSDGSAMFITIARYYTPSGLVIDHVGLKPDLTVEGEPNKDHRKDIQLQKAIQELKKKPGKQG